MTIYYTTQRSVTIDFALMPKKFTPKNISLANKGLAKVLGDLESQVMDVVWDLDTVTVRTVRDQLEEKQKKLAFNSVMTVMNRLIEKGLLKKKKQGGVYQYQTTVSRSDLSKDVATDMINSLFGDQLLLNSVNFMDLSEQLDQETIQKLKNFLK